MVQPQSLQILDEPVEELDVEPADLVDEAGVLLGDELDQAFDRDGAWGDSWLSRSIALRQDRQARWMALSGLRSSSSRRERSRRTGRPAAAHGSGSARARRARPRWTAGGRRIASACKGRPRRLPEPLRPTGQRPVEAVAQAHAGPGVGAKVSLAIDQDGRDPLKQELLDEPQRQGRLAAARGPQEGRMPRQLGRVERHWLRPAVARRADRERGQGRGSLEVGSFALPLAPAGEPPVGDVGSGSWRGSTAGPGAAVPDVSPAPGAPGPGSSGAT